MEMNGESGKFIYPPEIRGKPGPSRRSSDVRGKPAPPPYSSEVRGKPGPPPRSPKIRGKIPVHSPPLRVMKEGGRTDPFPPSKQIAQLLKELMMEEKTLRLEFGRREGVGSVDDVLTVIMSKTCSDMRVRDLRRLPFRLNVYAHETGQNLPELDGFSVPLRLNHCFISSSVHLDDVPSYLLWRALQSNQAAQSRIMNILKAKRASSLSKDDVGQKQKTKLQMGRGKSLSQTQQLPKDMTNKLDRLDDGGDQGVKGRIKSSKAYQVIGPLPLKTEMEGKSGKQQQLSQLLPRSPGIQRSDQHIELEVNKQKQMTEDDMDLGEPAQELTMEEEIAAEEEDFACYRSDWESRWGSKGGCGFFKGTTQLSSMFYTHLTPKPSLDDGIVANTLQIFSIKLAEIKGGFKWPLSVYGIVAARDPVDHNRNLLFCRSRTRSQIVQQNDPFLHLIGPSRAILFNDPVDFEIQLKVKCGAMSGDRALISTVHCYRARRHGVHTICFENCFCKIELCMELLVETIQATICSIRVVKQGIRQRVERRCRVACSTASYSRKVIDGKTTYVANASSGEVVLLDPGRHATPEGSEGYLDLSRRVVSVEHEGNLEFVVQAYSSSGDITAQGHVSLAPRSFGFSQKKFYVDDAQLEITVAWSFLVANKDALVRPVGF